MPPYLRDVQVAAAKGCCTKTVHRAAKTGRLPFVVIGNRRFFRPEDVAAWDFVPAYA